MKKSTSPKASLNPRSFIPNPIYHYTSADPLVSILKSGVLRATHFAFLNDSSEIRYGRQLAEKIIESRLGTKQMRPNGNQLLRHVKKALEDVGKGREFYVVCFCEKPNVLSQFLVYGSPGKGRFCIGFDTEEQPRPRDPLSPALYDEPEQRQKLRKAIDDALVRLDAYSSSRFLNRVRKLLVEKIVREICFFKHPGFKEEGEWRVVHEVKAADDIDLDVSSGRIRPFLDLWVGLDQGDGRPLKLPLAEVWVGPSAFQPQSMRSAQLLLTRCGYDGVEVKKSDVPYTR